MPTPILLDTNILVLVAVGLTDIRYIRRHKRLQTFDETDFQIVCDLIDSSSGVIFSPNILTETSNLIRYVGEPMKSEIAMTFSGMIERTEEQYIPSASAVSRSEHVRLGLADAVLLRLAETGATLLTDDHLLYLAAASGGLNAINYNHIREQRPDYQ